jgi:polyisoprenyl-teichoic acid--peptidoglycan teichoic acid transferase
MKGWMARPPRTRRQRVALTVALVALLCLALLAAGVGYTNYRVNRFAQTAFRDEATPPQTQYGAATPTTTPLPPTPTPTEPPAATAASAPPPTATPVYTPTPTPLPYGNSPVIGRLRAGERVTVLLLGFGGPGHDGGYLTDSIQVMSFDPRSGDATLISVPRDFWVYIPPFEGRGGYWAKVNEAYSVGMGKVDREYQHVPYRTHEQGGTLAAQVVAQVLGVPIDYWVSLDFVGFRQFVDALGGVDVDVQTAFTDDHYPNNDDAQVDPSYRTVHFDCGLQHLNGERAIEFARSRYSPQDGNDFSRSRRQQLLMSAVKEQVFRVDTIPRAFALLDALEDHFHTSFSFAEAKDLAGWAQEQARNKRPIAIRSAVLEVGDLLYSTTSPGGAYIILPRRGQGEYATIQRFVADTLGERSAATPGTPAGPGSPAALSTPAPTATQTPPVARSQPVSEPPGTPSAAGCGSR